jgi:hypothetical protein
MTAYSCLLHETFGQKSNGFSDAYLNWLYFLNPRGDVVGFDAWRDDELVAHYAAIPININGFTKPTLLSVNTATKDEFRGRGLFTYLANLTYESVRQKFSGVVGVANAKSLHGFTKTLNFEHLGNLDLSFSNLSDKSLYSRCYTLDEINWRISAPGRRISVKQVADSTYKITSFPFGPLIPISTLVSTKSVVTRGLADFSKIHLHNMYGLTLGWNRGRNSILKLPRAFKPSPLSLIYRSFDEEDSEFIQSWSFADFDVF